MDYFNQVSAFMDAPLEHYITNGKAALNEKEQMLVGVWVFYGEVMNHGFADFLYQTGGELVYEVLQGLKEIHALKTAELVEQGVALFLQNVPAELNIRQAIMESFDRSAHQVLANIEAELALEPDDLVYLLHQFMQQTLRT